jgi:hypothetical protein
MEVAMSKAALLLAAGALIALPLAPARATTTIYSAVLSGANEVPPTLSPGIGTMTLTVDDVAFTIRIQTAFSGLLSTDTAGLFHCCDGPTMNSPAATTVPAFSGFPLGVTSGAVDTTLFYLNSSFWNPTFLGNNGGTAASAASVFFDALAAGNVYFNIHTTNLPSGEIRGQLAPVTQGVPEPATWMMMLLGLGAVGLKIRRAGRSHRSRGASSPMSRARGPD